MSSRKRQSSTIEEKEGKVSKRARLLSSLWRSQEETVDSVEEILSTPSSAVYRIKAIIGERPGEYLIDWADNPITGESFKADWVSSKTNDLMIEHSACNDSIYRHSSRR